MYGLDVVKVNGQVGQQVSPPLSLSLSLSLCLSLSPSPSLSPSKDREEVLVLENP